MLEYVQTALDPTQRITVFGVLSARRGRYFAILVCPLAYAATEARFVVSGLFQAERARCFRVGVIKLLFDILLFDWGSFGSLLMLGYICVVFPALGLNFLVQMSCLLQKHVIFIHWLTCWIPLHLESLAVTDFARSEGGIVGAEAVRLVEGTLKIIFIAAFTLIVLCCGNIVCHFDLHHFALF